MESFVAYPGGWKVCGKNTVDFTPWNNKSKLQEN